MMGNNNLTDATNINQKYEFIWIAPERTGSRSTSRILTFCGFTSRGYPVCGPNNFDYTHSSEIPEKYKNYKVICNARNPYSRTLSLFKHYSYNQKTFDTITFKEYLQNINKAQFNGDSKYKTFINPVIRKQPDYVIRLENFYEDIRKIPFIFNHLTEKQLEMLCEHGKEIDEWESFYDQEMKDLVYKHLKHQFDMWGYER
jgi:hypothetical protein